MTSLHQEDFGHIEAIPRFLFRRFTRIFPVYWLICLPKVLLCDHPERFIQAFFLFPLPSSTPTFATTILGPAWTLSYEIWFYTLFAFMMLLPFDYFLYCMLGWAAFTLIHSLAGHPWMFFEHPIVIEFTFGALVAILANKKDFNYKSLASITLATFSLIMFGLYQHWYSFSQDYIRIFVWGTFSGLLLLACITWDKNKPIKTTWLTKLGDASYPIYLIHTLLFINLRKLVLFLPDTVYFHVLGLLELLLIAIGAGLLIHYWIEKPILAYFKNLNFAGLISSNHPN